ncbi:GNAT family N-acetyltransferase [Ktedonospora formicarum]|uniref:N-acetyltransferase n=1 Tax=Ktedonospora formicarum TaxID=2778364 RepID=A0A8J3HX94_9CHLR|nr:GNAT family protein [Ktedonospora formicarum]GHO45827.1 N-acetyltransferase [Ktedonospora formicarum]
MSIESAFSQFPTLTTERLRLRQIRPNDAESFFEIFSDEEAMRYYGHEPHTSIEETRARIQRIGEQYEQREALRWGITLKDDNTILGSCGFHHLRADFKLAETGYELKRSHWGQGIMAEAEAAVLEYGFNELGFHRVEAIIDIVNGRSKGLLLKLGFTYEGNLRQRFYFQGGFEDEHFFGLLKEEWNARDRATGKG